MITFIPRSPEAVFCKEGTLSFALTRDKRSSTGTKGAATPSLITLNSTGAKVSEGSVFAALLWLSKAFASGTVISHCIVLLFQPCDKEFFAWIAEHLIIVAGIAIAIAIVLVSSRRWLCAEGAGWLLFVLRGGLGTVR